MKKEFHEMNIHSSIDACLSGLNGNPFLAQRIIAAEKGEYPIVKKKISISFVLALLMLALTLSAGFALIHSQIGDQLFGNQENIPQAVIEQIQTPHEAAQTQLGHLSVDEWLYDGRTLHTSFTISNPTQNPLLYTLDGIFLNGHPVHYNRCATEGAGDSGLLLGGTVNGTALPSAYSLYNAGEQIVCFDANGKYQGMESLPQGEGLLKISVAVWRPLNPPELVDYNRYEGEEAAGVLDHLITDQSGFSCLWLFRPESHTRNTRYGESSALSYQQVYQELGWAELVGMIEVETPVSLDQDAIPRAIPQTAEYRQGELRLIIDSFELTQAGGQMECRLLGDYDTVKRYMAQGVQLVDRAQGRVLSSGCIDQALDGSQEGRTILLPLAPFSGELPEEVYLAPVVGFDSRWDETAPVYDPTFEKPDNVVAPFQFDFDQAFFISLIIQ